MFGELRKGIKLNIKDLPLYERPYERCLEHGVEALTDAELLAVIIRTGTKNLSSIALANKILYNSYSANGLHSIMDRSYEEYISIHGIGRVKAVQLICIGELVRRIWKSNISKENIIFSSPRICAGYYMQDMRYLKQEQLRIAYLDTKQRLISDSIISIGTVNASLISTREILIDILKHQAVNVIILHNHPSGNPAPSQEDIDVTASIKKGCTLVGVEFNDHIIIGDNKYFSFKEQGVL